MGADKPLANERLTYRLRLLSEQAINANDAIFVAKTGCNIRELRVLRLIDDSPNITFREIALITGLERSLTSRLIQKLISKKLITRENSDTDARVFMLATTDKGSNTRQIARKVSDKLETILTNPLSKKELDTMNELIDRMAVWVHSDKYLDALDKERRVINSEVLHID